MGVASLILGFLKMTPNTGHQQKCLAENPYIFAIEQILSRLRSVLIGHFVAKFAGNMGVTSLILDSQNVTSG